MNSAIEILKRLAASLYWRISLIFLLISSLLAILYIYITAETAEMYFQEASQKLNRDIAEHIVHDIQPFVDGAINEAELKHTFHNVMVLNPSLEVYLLDKNGSILSYFAPKSKVKMEQVNLGPIHQFIDGDKDQFITGEDPRNPGVQKVFSAAAISEGDATQGYIYVVLASEEYTSVTDLLYGSYRLQLAGKTILIALVASLIIGLIVIWLLIRNLRKVITTVNKFQRGDHSARINLRSQGELTQLANSFDQMADTIVKHINEIKSVEELRRELIANVSHDLRTPLAAIQGYAETLVMKSDTLSDEEKMRYTNTILEGTEKIKKLVDDLFQLSKLETRQIEAHFEYFSLQELVHDIGQKYELLASQQEIAIETSLESKNLPPIYADIALIDRVLQNLVDNALQHTPKGGKITIEIHSAKEGVEVVVADTGLGIKEDEIPYIFERYRQSNSNKKEGAGLGLAIVKKILELHHSTISVESKINAGTAFTFHLATSPIA